VKIFDSHCHIESGLEQYNIDTSGRNIIFNTIASYQQFADKVPENDVISIVFDYRDNYEVVKEIISTGKLKALKIHSKIQKIAEQHYPVLMEKLEGLNTQIPIIIDAVYYGDELEYQPSLKYIIAIAKKFRNNPIIVAHSGGYNVLEYFYHLKTLDNVFFDLSLSLSYMRHTSVFVDFKNLIRFGDSKKILFGTDYPLIDPKTHLDVFMEVAGELKMSEDTIHQILFSNSEKLFR
jgi:predicted TIM-barrel fold metal-dependent hydrolase